MTRGKDWLKAYIHRIAAEKEVVYQLWIEEVGPWNEMADLTVTELPLYPELIHAVIHTTSCTAHCTLRIVHCSLHCRMCTVH